MPGSVSAAAAFRQSGEVPPGTFAPCGVFVELPELHSYIPEHERAIDQPFPFDDGHLACMNPEFGEELVRACDSVARRAREHRK